MDIAPCGCVAAAALDSGRRCLWVATWAACSSMQSGLSGFPDR